MDACRLTYAMDLVVIFCELVIAVCTLVYLFSLRHSLGNSMDETSHGEDDSLQHRPRDIAFGFLSLACTLAVLLATVIGPDKLARGAQAAWTRVSETSVRSLSVFRHMRRCSDFSTSVGVVPVLGDVAVHDQEARDGVVAEAG